LIRLEQLKERDVIGFSRGANRLMVRAGDPEVEGLLAVGLVAGGDVPTHD